MRLLTYGEPKVLLGAAHSIEGRRPSNAADDDPWADLAPPRPALHMAVLRGSREDLDDPDYPLLPRCVVHEVVAGTHARLALVREVHPLKFLRRALGPV